MSKKLPPEFRVPHHPDNTAIDKDGHVMPMTSDQVASYMETIISKGEVVLAIFEYQNELAVQSFGPPSQRLLTVLETALRGYRKALENVS